MRILIKGAGDLASGIAYELWKAGHQILMTEIEIPLAVRRQVAFSRAVYEGEAIIEDAKGVLVYDLYEALQVTAEGNIAVIVDEKADIREQYQPDVLVDAIMAKKNTGTAIMDAPMVIGIGPGFFAGKDSHYVIETMRGDTLGKVILRGMALPNTGIPGNVAGYTTERLIRASAEGVLEPVVKIGDLVEKGQIVARIGGVSVYAQMTGIIRGMLTEGVQVSCGLKIGDIDARKDRTLCYMISDKARCIGCGVLNAMKTQEKKQCSTLFINLENKI